MVELYPPTKALDHLVCWAGSFFNFFFVQSAFNQLLLKKGKLIESALVKKGRFLESALVKKRKFF